MAINYRQKRKSARSRAWPETEASIKFFELTGSNKARKKTITGRVIDLGASGMFLKTTETVPIHSDVDIEIRFDPKSESSDLMLHARGKTTRLCREGVGIEFKSIDLGRMQKCIIEKMHRVEKIVNTPTAT